MKDAFGSILVNASSGKGCLALMNASKSLNCSDVSFPVRSSIKSGSKSLICLGLLGKGITLSGVLSSPLLPLSSDINLS